MKEKALYLEADKLASVLESKSNYQQQQKRFPFCFFFDSANNSLSTTKALNIMSE